MKIFKVVYYDPETDKYIHQSINCHLQTINEGMIYFTKSTETTTLFLVLALNINNLISIEQVS